MRIIFVNQLPLDYFRNSENGLVCIRSSLTVHALPIYVLCVRIKSMSFRPLINPVFGDIQDRLLCVEKKSLVGGGGGQ